MKTHQITVQVSAPDDATPEAITRLIDVLVTNGQEERIADDKALDDAPGLAAQVKIGSVTAVAPMTVMVGIEGGLVTGATASGPVDVIVADYDLADFLDPADLESRDVVTLSAGMECARRGFVAIKHAALVELGIIEGLRAKMAERGLL